MKYLFNLTHRLSYGACIYWHTWLNAKVLSGLECVAYIRVPKICIYLNGSKNKRLSAKDKFYEVLIREVIGSKSEWRARWRTPYIII